MSNSILKKLASYKHHLKLDWHKGYLFVAYFLLLVLIDIITKGDFVFVILAWPLYLVPQRLLAAILQLLFVYLLVTVIDVLFLHKAKKRKKT